MVLNQLLAYARPLAEIFDYPMQDTYVPNGANLNEMRRLERVNRIISEGSILGHLGFGTAVVIRERYPRVYALMARHKEELSDRFF